MARKPQTDSGPWPRSALAGVRVLEFADQIAGPYCGKLLVDAGAEVIKVETAAGDSLRRWSASGADLGGEDSALFRFLNAGKRSVVGELTDPHVRALLAEADLVVAAHGLESDGARRVDAARLCAENPSLVVLSITPYGLGGPWAERRATEFTLQAEAGSTALRGLMGQEPFQVGGRMAEWGAAAYGAAAALPAVLRGRAGGRGELIDLSVFETANLIFTQFAESMNRLMNGGPGDPEMVFILQSVETPSVEPTKDGYVGLCTNARQQFLDFLLLIERPDLQEDEQITTFAGRMMRFDEWKEIMHGWLRTKTTAEVIEGASLLRIPVAPVCNGQTVLEQEQLVARGVFGPDAEDRFRRPRRPYRIDDADPPAPLPPPRLGEHTATAKFPAARAPRLGFGEEPDSLPLAGVRILDFTGWWAGPACSHLLATLGAEVIHVESTARIDGIRSLGGMVSAHYEKWWEASAHYLHTNANKLGITLDLNKPRGRQLFERLVGRCDAVLENFTPRVLDNFGLGWEKIRELNPRAILMRMPAFGLSGPWRDHPGFAQTMEQLAGQAWVTGHAADQPRIPRGPCDPVAGMHAVVAFLVALAEREISGRGHHVESTMVESALNVAAEQVIEWTAYGRLLQRDGNRSALAAPQGLYPCFPGEYGMPVWLALSVASDEQWRALRRLLGDPGWAADPGLDTLAGRRAAHDAIDVHLSEWTHRRRAGELESELRAAGIPASEVVNPSRLSQANPQLRARRYFEALEHPVVGALPLPSLPFRYASVERWLRTPAPTLGEHNRRVLSGLLGLSARELEELEAEGVIGTRPVGA